MPPTTRHRRHRSSAFSLIELMIVLGVIGLLLALLTPAVQYARESSRRTQCLSNLRQLGVALQAYHDAVRRLPPAAIWGKPGEPLGQGFAPPGTIDRVSLGVATASEPDRMHANWLILLLPFFEQAPLYASFDTRQPIADPINRAARLTEIPVLKCPSDIVGATNHPFERASQPTADQLYARGNYALNGGSNDRCLMRLSSEWPPGTCTDGFQVNGTDLASDTTQVWGSGVGGLNKSFRFADFPAGLSRTVAVEEIRVGVHPHDRRGVWVLGFPGSSVTVAHGLGGNRGPNAGKDAIQGCGAVKAAMGVADPPCSESSRLELSEQATARSLHADGVNVLVTDGSAHFVSNDVDARAWHEMHKRDSRSAVNFAD